MVWLITIGCIVAYIAGLVLLVRIMPSLLKRTFDEALFIGVAAVAIFGAMLVFGAVGVTFAVFIGGTGVRIFDGLLLLILGIVALRTSINAFRPRYDSYLSANRNLAHSSRQLLSPPYSSCCGFASTTVRTILIGFHRTIQADNSLYMT